MKLILNTGEAVGSKELLERLDSLEKGRGNTPVGGITPGGYKKVGKGKYIKVEGKKPVKVEDKKQKKKQTKKVPPDKSGGQVFKPGATDIPLSAHIDWMGSGSEVKIPGGSTFKKEGYDWLEYMPGGDKRYSDGTEIHTDIYRYGGVLIKKSEASDMEKAELTPMKARKILHDKEVNGKPLTEQQRKFFGAVANSTTRKATGPETPEEEERQEIKREEKKDPKPPPLPAMKKCGDAIEAKSKKACGEAHKSMYSKMSLGGGTIQGIPGVESSTTTLDVIEEEVEATREFWKANKYSAVGVKEFPKETPIEELKLKSAIDELGDFAKAIYIGPRGGRWLDPKHTIPYKTEKKKEPAAKKEPAKVREVPKVAFKESVVFVHGSASNVSYYTKQADGSYIENDSQQRVTQQQLERRAQADNVKEVKVHKPTEKSAINELSDFAKAEVDLVKCYNDSRTMDQWSNKFYSNTGLNIRALECAKDMLKLEQEEAAWRKTRTSYEDREDWSRKKRNVYSAKRSKEESVFSKRRDELKQKMAGLDVELVDYQIKEAKAQESARKSLTLDEWLEENDMQKSLKSEEENTMGKENLDKSQEAREVEAEPKVEKSGLDELLDFSKDQAMAKGSEVNLEGVQGLLYLKSEMSSERMAEFRKAWERMLEANPNADRKALGELLKAHPDVEWEEFEKAQAMPTGNPKQKLGQGSEQGEGLAGVGKTGGSNNGGPGPGQSADGQVKAPKSAKDKLSEDEEHDEKNMTEHKKPIESANKSMAIPSNQREMVTKEHAQVVARLRKGDTVEVEAGGGLPPEPEPAKELEKATVVRQGMVIYSDQSDIETEALLKSDTFYTGGAPTVIPFSRPIGAGKVCLKCKTLLSKSLSACPECGEGTVVHRVLPGGEAQGDHDGEPIVKSRAGGLRPRIEKDVFIK